MSEDQKIAVVTGGNRGIGFAICKALKDAGLKVVLTGRSEALSRQAANEIGVDYAVIDVSKPASIESFAQYAKRKYGRIDVLVNNAGVLLDPHDRPSLFDAKMDDIKDTMQTNVYGPIRLVQLIVPIMRQNDYGRIVNISSGMGQLSDMNDGYIAYRMSKTALNAVTRVTSEEVKGENILVNSMCPGWVKTEMGGPNAEREPGEAAETAVWLATLPKGGPTGKFFRDKQEIDW